LKALASPSTVLVFAVTRSGLRSPFRSPIAMLGATWTASRCSSAGGDGSFRPKTDYGKTKDPELPAYFFSSVALGDLNGDGKPDVTIGTDADSVSVFINSGNGRLLPRAGYRTWATANGLGPRCIATASSTS
jgi:hypothetical protein